MAYTPLEIAVITHVPFEGPELIETWFLARGHTVRTVPLYHGAAAARLKAARTADLVVVMGGPMSVGDIDSYPWLIDELAFLKQALRSGVPILGVCLGAQLIAAAAGASVYPNRIREIGWWPVELAGGSLESDGPAAVWRTPFSGAHIPVFQWHGDTFDLPAGARLLARSDACENQAFAIGDRVVALQFHLESTPLSVARISAACRAEIGRSVFERRSGTLDPMYEMIASTQRLAGYGRPLLIAVLEQLERAAFGDSGRSRPC
jgi:GMP synthase-like glutamine amidotransferase